MVRETALPADDLGCGGAEHLCFDRDVDHVRPGNWTYTGHGRGAYEKIEDMHFVGQGRGSWDRERHPVYGWRCNPCCLCFCGVLLLGVIASLVVGILWRHGMYHDTHRDPVQPMFDCAVDYFHWETAWPAEKKAWCCAQLGKGCQVASKPFDCDAAFNNWQKAWSEAKKAYCCAHEQRGCPGDDCYAGSQDTWPEAKRTWCCRKHALGCPKDDYDCRAGVSNWRHGWSESKKYFCCKKYDVACPDSVVYDCHAGIPVHWHSAKQAWCCQHGGHCVSSTYDCSAGYTSWQSRWSQAKADWCCLNEQRGCHHSHTTVVEHVPVPVPVPVHHVVYHSHPVPVPVPVPVVVHEHHGYDCWHGATWSPSKRHYCCANHNLGCSSHVHVVHVIHHVHGHFDCQAGQANWKVGWSLAKRHWCCAEYMVACPQDSGPSPSLTSSVVHTYENGDDVGGTSTDSGFGAVDGDFSSETVEGDSSSEVVEGDSASKTVEGDYLDGDSASETVEGDSVEGDSTSETVDGDFPSETLEGDSSSEVLEGDSTSETVEGDSVESAESESVEGGGTLDGVTTEDGVESDVSEGSGSTASVLDSEGSDTFEHPFLATPLTDSAVSEEK